MRDRLGKWSPPGWDGSGEWYGFWILMIFSILYSFQFWSRYWKAYQALFYFDRQIGEKVLEEGAVMEPFWELSEGCFLGCFLGFFLLLFLSFLFAALRYFYYYQESRSIYLVRRLPDRGFLWKSCVVVPVLGILLDLFVMGMLCLTYWGCYRIFTPAETLRR